MTDDQLLEMAQRGDRAALEELCRREWRPVYGVVYQAVGNRADAQDLTQEVFLRALRSLDRYQRTGVPFRAYLATIARNLVRDGWRKKRPPLVGLDHASEIPFEGLGPEERTLSSFEKERLQASLATLSADYQTVIRLRVLDGLPTPEVARIMNRNPAAVRQLQHRALTALRARLLDREESRS